MAENQTFMGVLVTCKNEKDPFKNEGARVITTSLLWLALLPARMKKIQSKMMALEWSQQCNIIHQYLRCSRAANSLIGDGILMKFIFI